MSNAHVLLDELNKRNHLCVHSKNACSFCVGNLRVQENQFPNFQTVYIAPFEVVVHNKPDDLWVSFLGMVFDLTSLVQSHANEECVRPLIAYAGKDISHWFDEITGELRHYVHPLTGVKIPYCPNGPLPDVAPQVPSTQWYPLIHEPWWRSERLYVGPLSKRVRPVRVMNCLIRLTCELFVCCEDKMWRVQQRYAQYNSNVSSYVWMCEGRLLDMDKTLEENGVIDERDVFTDVGLPESTYTPLLMLHFADDLK